MDYVILRYGSLYGERSDRRNSIYKMLDDAISKGKIQYFPNKMNRMNSWFRKGNADCELESWEKMGWVSDFKEK